MENTKQARIEKYLQDMDDIDLIDLVRDVNNLSGSFEPWTFYGMDELDDIFYGMSPTEIIELVQYADDNFNTCEDFFSFDECGCLNSCDVESAADLIRTDILEDLAGDFANYHYKEVLYNSYPSLYDIVYND